MKCTLEFPTGPKTWRSIQVPVSFSRNGNNVAKYDGKIYVWINMREGEPILSLSPDKKWVQVGRVTHGTVFIGSPFPVAMSYSEYLYSDTGMEESKRMLNSLTSRARDLNGGKPSGSGTLDKY